MTELYNTAVKAKGTLERVSKYLRGKKGKAASKLRDEVSERLGEFDIVAGETAEETIRRAGLLSPDPWSQKLEDGPLTDAT